MRVHMQPGKRNIDNRGQISNRLRIPLVAEDQNPEILLIIIYKFTRPMATGLRSHRR